MVEKAIKAIRDNVECLLCASVGAGVVGLAVGGVAGYALVKVIGL